VTARIKEQYGVDDAKAGAAMAAYRKDIPNRSAADVLMAVASDALVRTPMLRAADIISASKHAPLYVYNFGWKVPFDGGMWGSPHTVDIPFAFGNVDKAKSMTGGGPVPQEISRALMSAFVAFARTGNPNNARMPNWEPYDSSGRATMVVNEKPKLEHDYLGGDRRASAELGDQSVYQIITGPLFRYTE
jgi:para-nitrobenzyl esterase